jgi:NADH:ubiquinone oxidoreductase subunit 6 (subunit J)
MNTMVELFTFLSLVGAIAAFSTFSAHAAIYCMILSFLFSGIVYYLLTATYLAMILFVVYVGAVAMLFVFCVMLLNLVSRPRRTFGTAGYFFFFLYVSIGFVLAAGLYGMGAMTDFAFFTPDLTLLSGDHSWGALSSKDQFLSHSMYGTFLPFLVVNGLLLFFVTVLVTVLFDSNPKGLIWGMSGIP